MPTTSAGMVPDCSFKQERVFFHYLPLMPPLSSEPVELTVDSAEAVGGWISFWHIIFPTTAAFTFGA